MITLINSKQSPRLMPACITYGFHATRFGLCLIGVTQNGQLCHLSFVQDERIAVIMQQWPGISLKRDQQATQSIVQSIFQNNCTASMMEILVQGTDFQMSVWNALLKIPRGVTMSYSDVAASIGHPKAVRAAASAIAQNTIAHVIPCHRVITKSGKVHRYRWGSHIKAAMLAHEQVI